MGIHSVWAMSRSRPAAPSPAAPAGTPGLRLLQFGAQQAPAARPRPLAPDVFIPPAPPVAPPPPPVAAPAPPLPRPAPPAPVAPAPAPVPAKPAPAPAPVAPAPAAPAMDLPGLRPGMRFQLDRGTRIQGHGISGEAQVQRFDGKTLELLVDASAAMGFVRMKLGIRCEVQPDGSMRITAQELGRNGQPEKTHFDDRLQVMSSRRGEIVLRGPDGQPGALRMAEGGVVVLEHPAAGRIILRPR